MISIPVSMYFGVIVKAGIEVRGVIVVKRTNSTVTKSNEGEGSIPIKIIM
jgi:hypothetical protein